MRRREFISLIGGPAAALPLAARAQQLNGVQQVGVLMGLAESDPVAQSEIAAFRQELQKLGWTGRNVRIAYRWSARVSDPVGSGFVNSLAKPNGNVTGLIFLEASLAGKWVQLLKEMVPGLARVTLMFNPATASGGGLDFLRIAEAAASPMGIEVKAAHVHDVADIERAIVAVADEANGGLINLPDIFLAVHRELTVELTARHRVPRWSDVLRA